MGGVVTDAECFLVWGGCSRRPRVMSEAPIILLAAFAVCCRTWHWRLCSSVTTWWCSCWGCFNSGSVAGGHDGCQGSRALQFHGVLNPLGSIKQSLFRLEQQLKGILECDFIQSPEVKISSISLWCLLLWGRLVLCASADLSVWCELMATMMTSHVEGTRVHDGKEAASRHYTATSDMCSWCLFIFLLSIFLHF